MATIDPNGVLIYQDTDNYTPIHTALNLAQSNLSSLLGASTQIVRVSSVGDRNAKATARGSISKANPFVAWRADAADGLQLEYTTNGTTWRTIADKEYYDSLDTAWVSASLASRYAAPASVRRIGNQVHVHWVCTTSIAANDAALPLLTLPVGYRPSTDVAPAVGGQSLYPWTGRITMAGAVQVRNNHTAAQTNMIGSASYIAA